MRWVVSLLCAVFLSSCSSTPGDSESPPYQATLDQRLLDHKAYHNLVIATVNLGKASRTYVIDREKPIDEMIEKRLVKAGYNIMPSNLFDDAWTAAVHNWGEPYNRSTDKLNMETLQHVLGETFATLAKDTEINGVVFTNLEETQVYFAPSGGHTAHFYGVSRKPASKGGNGVPAGFDWIQGVDAISLFVEVFDMKGVRLYDGAGGIEVTETLDLKPSTPRWVRSKKILENEDFIEEGIDLALRKWVGDK